VPGPFALASSSTGAVWLVAPLDYETAAVYSFDGARLEAVHNTATCASGSLELRFELGNINDNAPVATYASLSVMVGTANLTVVHQCEAVDADGDVLVFTLVDSLDNGFEVTADGAVVLVGDAVTLNVSTVHPLNISVSDGLHAVYMEVIITMIDIACSSHADKALTVDQTLSCTCNTGYSGDGFVCDNVDECAAHLDTCPLGSACTNTDGSFACVCVLGWSGDGATCVDLNECLLGTGTCGINAVCENTDGSFLCLCLVGLTGNGLTCNNYDECALHLHTCHVHAACTDSFGSYTCACNTGYTGNGETCVDMNECTAFGDNALCPVHGHCINTDGSFFMPMQHWVCRQQQRL
jgi:hypothetical protein